MREVAYLDRNILKNIQTLAVQAGVFCFTSKRGSYEKFKKNDRAIYSTDRPGKKECYADIQSV